MINFLKKLFQTPDKLQKISYEMLSLPDPFNYILLETQLWEKHDGSTYEFKQALYGGSTVWRYLPSFQRVGLMGEARYANLYTKFIATKQIRPATKEELTSWGFPAN